MSFGNFRNNVELSNLRKPFSLKGSAEDIYMPFSKKIKSLEVPVGVLKQFDVESFSEQADLKQHLQTFDQRMKLMQIVLAEEVDAMTCMLFLLMLKGEIL